MRPFIFSNLIVFKFSDFSKEGILDTFVKDCKKNSLNPCKEEITPISSSFLICHNLS
ncbi:hypothetical protein LEP1GSC088_0689 [Leptospira interrogans str. L1207]|nr:hypothetical protein LEP1GSC088_0689 [Leptospira interrogans str. L1207]